MNFERMVMLREDNDLTQKQMADILNVSRSAYSLWEIGKNTIPLDKLNNFCNHFNVSIDYITELSNVSKYNVINKSFNLKSVGKNLKTIRTELGLTQEQLADKLNTTHSVISSYENGKVLIQTLFIIEIAKISKKSIDWILGKIK